MSTPRRRVLVVDDDEEIVESLRFALHQHGYDVITANDGAEALARVERDLPDLVILDLVMPRRSGLAVLERISRHAARAPHIILLSGSDYQRHREFVESRGVVAMLSKPFDLDELLAQVDAVLQM